jgi:hypothetical protein
MTTTIETKTAEVTFDLRVECSECGAELEAEYTEDTSYGRTTRTLSVGACSTCLEKAAFEGKQEGRHEAEEEAGTP